MKAWVLHGIDDFRYEEHEEPVPADGEVLVHVRAAGICGSDIPRVYQTGAHIHPLVLGHEFSGDVVKTEERFRDKWLGKRVGVFPLIPCGMCVPCCSRQYEMCRNYSYLGSRRDGAFTDYVAVPEANLIELPDNVTYEQAAMLEPMSVAVHAMRRGFALSRGKSASELTAAVCGLGTIGLFMVMFLRQAGVKNILAAGNKDFQKKQLSELGIPKEQYCDSRQCDVHRWIMDRTDGAGVDLFFECVGKNETVLQAVESTMPAGGVVLLGNPYSDMHFRKNVYWKILRNQLMVTGTWNSSFTHEDTDDWHYVLDCLKSRTVAPEGMISHTYSMEQLIDGFHIMRDKTEDYVKIMGVNKTKPQDE